LAASRVAKAIASPVLQSMGLGRDLRFRERVVELLLELGAEGAHLVRRDVAELDQMPEENVADGRMVLDGRVHERLGEARLVALIVAVAAVAEHVDHDILVELLPELERELDGGDRSDGVVAVDVEDGHAEHFRHARAVGRRGTVDRRGGEADLVVDDDVDRAAGAVALKLREIERLGHDALADERGVAVQQDGQHLAALARVVKSPLPGAGLALNHGIDGLEMTGIRREADADLDARGSGRDRFEAEVILHVTVAHRGVGHVVLGEFVEDELVVLAQDVGEDVEAAAVGHAHDDLLDAVARAVLHDLVEERDDGLPALERETLLADVAGVEELLEQLALEQVRQHPLFLRVGEAVLAQRARFEPVAQPAADGEILDVHVLDAGVAAVGLLHQRDDRAQGHVDLPAAEDELELGVEIGLGELHVLERDLGRGALAEVERVELGDAVAEAAVGADQRVHPCLLDPVGLSGRGRNGAVRASVPPNRQSGAGPLRWLLAAELEAGEEGVPLGIDAGGIGLPLLVKGFKLRTVVGRGGVGAGSAGEIGIKRNPGGHDCHRIA
jgi:hypothetical protein